MAGNVGAHFDATTGDLVLTDGAGNEIARFVVATRSLNIHASAALNVGGVAVDGGSLAVAGLTASAAELNLNDNATVGAAVASKTLVSGALKEVPSGQVEVVTDEAANFVVSAAMSGAIFRITAADKVATLPSTVKGLRYGFLVTAAALSSGTGFSVSPAAADKIMGNGFTPLDNKDAINSGASDAEGDYLELVGDGADGWYVTRVIGTWARE